MKAQKVQLTGIIGYPLDHSLSPLLHNTAFEALRLNWYYQKFEVAPAEFAACIHGIRALDIRGVSVTIPYKERVIRFLDSVIGAAGKIGAVNTIINRSGRLIGYNTDYLGFLMPLNQVMKKTRMISVGILGAGGAARAVLYGLLSEFCLKQVIILNRNRRRAENLVAWAKKAFKQTSQYSIESLYSAQAEHRLSGVDLIVNATPVGLYPNKCVMPVSTPEVFRAGQTIYDLIYNPAETVLLNEARKRGARTINGFDMLLGQGAEAFRLWTGKKMPVESVRSVLLYCLRRHPGFYSAEEG